MISITDLDAEVRFGSSQIVITPHKGQSFDLIQSPTKTVKSMIEMMIRRSILKDFVAIEDSDKPRRKDMVGIPEYVDQFATTSILRLKKCPIEKLSLAHFRRLVTSLIAGSLRAGDRLHAAKMTETDTCECGQRQTLHHILWSCTLHRHRRKEYLRSIAKMKYCAKMKGVKVAAYIEQLAENACFQHTGISSLDPEALEWSRQNKAVSEEKFTDIAQQQFITDGAAQHEIIHQQVKYAAIFTDGSAHLVNAPHLAYGGWGVYVASNSPCAMVMGPSRKDRSPASKQRFGPWPRR
jgi:hypothetical protein